MDFDQAAKLVNERLKEKENKLWCLNTCLIWDITLWEASTYGYKEIEKLLIEAGAEPLFDIEVEDFN